MNKKVGIMGGTFDPIHNVHLIIAQCALESYQLDEILFVPSGIPWLKDISKVLNKKTRVSLTGLAIEGNQSFALSTIEIDREGNSYSYKTVEELKEQNPDVDYYFIMGADSLFEIETWKNPAELMKNCIILVAVRDEYNDIQMNEQIHYLQEKYHAEINLLQTPRLDISSTDIRRKVAEGKSIRYMLPDSVIDYIKKLHLYESSDSVDK